MANLLTVTVNVGTRPLCQRLVRFPFLVRGHYRTMRRNGHGRVVSVYGAWVLSGVVITFPDRHLRAKEGVPAT